MKNIVLLLTFFLCSVNVKSASINPSIFKDSTIAVTIKDNPKSTLQFVAKLSTKQLETYLGRKLKFKEKLGLKILKYKVAQQSKKRDGTKSKQGQTSLTLGILSLVFLILFPLASIPLGILAITNGRAAQKINPEDKDASAGITMGIISLAILALALILVIALIISLFRFY